MRTFDWEVHNNNWAVKSVIFDEGIYRIRITVEEDTDHDWTDGRGTWGAQWQPGAIKSPWRDEHNALPWFYPEETVASRLNNWLALEGITIDDARRHVVRELKEDIKIARDGGEYFALGVSVTIFLAATSTELAEASLWGIEVSTDADPYLDEVANDLIGEALEAAEKMTVRIKKALA